jgi:hypothetical protein
MAYELYQVFSEGENKTLVVDNVENYNDAVSLYEEKNGFMLIGVDAPTAFGVIFARPYGMSVIS